MTHTASTRPHEAWDRPFVKTHQKWCDDFVIELRLRDVPGPVIGEHLAEVEAHCAEAGEAPDAAFGDATAYAAQLDEAGAPVRETGAWAVAVTAAASVLALIVGTAAAGAWARGEQLSYNLAQIGALTVFVAVLLALPALLRPFVRRPWSVGVPVFVLATVAAIGTAAGGELDLPTLLTLPPSVVCLALFAAVVVLSVVEHRQLSDDDGANLVTSPLPPTPGAGGRRRLVTAVLPAALVPAAYVVLSAVSWFTAR